MRRLAAVMLVSLLLAVPASSYAQIPFAFFKASVNLTVQFPGTDKNGNPAVSVRKLSSNDILNLALGRSLTTKPDKNTEILALAMDDGSPGADSKLIVYNPSANSVTTTVWAQSNATLVFNGVEDSSGVGIAIRSRHQEPRRHRRVLVRLPITAIPLHAREHLLRLRPVADAEQRKTPLRERLVRRRAVLPLRRDPIARLEGVPIRRRRLLPSMLPQSNPAQHVLTQEPIALVPRVQTRRELGRRALEVPRIHAPNRFDARVTRRASREPERAQRQAERGAHGTSSTLRS